MTDQEKLHRTADALHDWLRKWPAKSRGARVERRVELDGVLCRLTLTPLEVVSNRRMGRIKAWLTRLKKHQEVGVYD